MRAMRDGNVPMVRVKKRGNQQLNKVVKEQCGRGSILQDQLSKGSRTAVALGKGSTPKKC